MLAPAAADATTRTWRESCDGRHRLSVSGYVRGVDGRPLADDTLLSTLACFDPADSATIGTWLTGLDGMFGMVFETAGYTIAVADAVRSHTLVWTRTSTGPTVSHDPLHLAQWLGLGADAIDPAQAQAFSMSGFSIGATTLFPAIHPVGPGRFLVIKDGAATEHRYHQWRPWRAVEADMATLKAQLASIHEGLIEALIASADGRRILVPLSAGMDSRFIVSGLKAAGYPNVRCFTYGQPGNREAATGREIAHRLNYEWIFVPYTQQSVRAAWHSEAMQAFWRFADRLDAVPFIQDFVALTALQDRGWLADEPIVVNGQSGDFISGNHVPATLFDPRGDGADARRRRILDALIGKHFRLWRSLSAGSGISAVEGLLNAEIDSLGGLPDDPAGDHGVVEYCEFQDRQSKYVIGGQRTYDWFGLDWRLPLWERPCLDFWESAPLAAKHRQSLYHSVLHEADWGGVWRNLPVNPARIRPVWLAPLRLLAKAAHAPLGAARWHTFEKRYLEYWMAPLCHYAPWPWRQVAADRRGFSSPYAWYAAEYLQRHGRTWDGAVGA